MGSTGKTSTVETVREFIERAVGENDRVIVYRNDAEAITGTARQVLNDKRLDGYFAGFSFDKDGRVEIQLVYDADTAVARLKRKGGR